MDGATLLRQYLELGRGAPFAVNEPLPEEVGLDIQRSLVCPAQNEFDGFAASQPWAGMPYGAAPLAESEYQTLIAWLDGGAQLPVTAGELPDNIASEIAAWESFLNAPSARNQLMSRYLYEHLFLARLHIPGDDPRRFFQMFRSTTPPGEPIGVIATRRPFDDPGDGPFYYRLAVVDETIVHKDHLVYDFGPERRARYETLFLESDWSLDTLPAYGESEGGNPFTTFAAIPARSRYQYLLDDALFFVRSFIRGPVCHGQTAVDVIEDRFWVSFLDPDTDLSITDPSFLRDGAEYLELPVTLSESGLLLNLQSLSHANQARYLSFRDDRYRASELYRDGFTYDAIWDGDGTNDNAHITVFRHFDNASALTGFHGGVPETAWVIDYPIFERIYYDLVAGYDVFGRVEHQISTRLYMDELRMEGEDTFLFFMPRDQRAEMHASWYRGTLAEVHTYWHRRRVDDDFPTGIDFVTDDPKAEFLQALLDRGEGLWPVTDPINRCAEATCDQPGEDTVAGVLRGLANQRGAWVRFLPDLSVLAVEGGAKGPETFTIAHDKAHTNIAFIFDENARREPEDDVLTILPEFIGSYPNFYFVVDQDDLGAFVRAVRAIRSQADWMEVVSEFGLRRTSPDFWSTSDRIQTLFDERDPIQAGIFDLNRYTDPKADEEPN